MKTSTVFAWTLGLALLVPTQAESQQDAALIARGAEVFSTTCGRCHNVRSAVERNDREWMVITAHMRARANLAKSQAAAVLAFLQATNVPEGDTPRGSMPGPGMSVSNVVPPIPAGSRLSVPVPRGKRR